MSFIRRKNVKMLKEFLGHYRWARRGSRIRRPMSILRSAWLAFRCTFSLTRGVDEAAANSVNAWDKGEERRR